MDDDIFPELSILNAKKTYFKKTKNVQRPETSSNKKKDLDEVENTQPLTTKVAVKLLLEGKLKSKVCRYCLNITPGLSELDQIMRIAGSGNVYKVTIRDIVASSHPFKVVDDPNLPDKICQKCLDRALGAYLFTQQCEQSERALLNCFDDMYEKLEKLDPIDRPKKRGRQKLHPNYNKLHAEHNNVIDYAEPVINIVNVGAETTTTQPQLNELECKKCCQLLPNMESLLNHEKKHPKTMWYNCRLCGKSFPKLNQLRKHQHKVHVLGKEVYPQVENDFKCRECGHVTDNFIQHLQHVEKHRFRNILEHLIEKRMDTLCVVCFNKANNMTELDKMVCIHGGHPELMGDKTLYTLLASTLPNPSSYKYQELYIPSEARKMTIMKRKSPSVRPSIKKYKIYPTIKQHFVFSNPIVVSKKSFKTNHFYYYVYSDPEYQKHISYKFDRNGCKIALIKVAPKPKIDEITEIKDITETPAIQPPKRVYLPTKINAMITDDLKCNLTDDSTKKRLLIQNVVKTYNENKRKHESQETTEIDIPQEDYEFSNPVILDGDNVKKRKIEEFESVTSHSDVNKVDENNDFKQEETAGIDNQRLKKQADNNWIFNKTTLNSNNDITKEKKTNCNYCWVFKDLLKCHYCERPNQNTENSVTKPITSEVKQRKEITERPLWQCSVCLTNNNADRLTCHCCETIRVTNYIKVTLGDHKNLFQTNKSEIDKHTDDKEAKINNLEVEEIDVKQNITEEMMDCKTNSPDTETNAVNINMQTMDTESNTSPNVRSNLEFMEVEEDPVCLESSNNITNLVIPTNVGPNVETNVQFNIGRGEQKPVRRFKRALRNVSRAIHK